MRYGSVCSGIEAASVAWEPLGWKAQWVSEIEHFPSAVLKHRFPDVPNLGDMTKIHENQIFNNAIIDILVGGTPCQSFSVAGLRKGMDDQRGQLSITFGELAARKRPRWIVWENVPGVLSSNNGEDFASFLGMLTGREVHPPDGKWATSGYIPGISAAYGIAWTVLDAQYFGVAQRRRRVFVVGHLGDWRPASAVLFESYRLQGHPKPSRTERQETTGGTKDSLGESGYVPPISNAICARDYKGARPEANQGSPLVVQPTWWDGGQPAATLTKQNANGAQRMPDKDNFGAVITPATYSVRDDITPKIYEEQSDTIRAGDYKGAQVVSQPIPFDIQCGSKRKDRPEGGFYVQENPDNARTLDTTGGLDPSCNQGGLAIGQPIPFRKSKRAQSKEDDETWVEDEQTNTLNTFDLTGDVRATNVVVEPTTYVLAGEHPQKGISEEIAPTLPAAMGMGGGHTPLVTQPIAFDTFNQTTSDVNQTIKSPQGGLNESIGVVVTPIAVDCYNQTINTETSQTIGSSATDVNHYGAVLEPIVIDRAAFNQGQNAQFDIKIEASETMPSLVARGPHALQHIPPMAIRRLTPKECERLQGFPDDWTRIPYRNKPEYQCPDGPRYKACGNSMAVPVMAWIGKRIEMVQNLLNENGKHNQ